MNRRAALALSAGLGTVAWPAAQAAPAFTHVVVVFQENRTPDNIFGSNPTFEPGVDIATTGQNSRGQTVQLQAEPIASCYDVSHTNEAFSEMYDGGKMDGADREIVSFQGLRLGQCIVPPNPQFKFADNSTGDVQPYFDIATQYGFANRMFQTNQGPSFPAHQFIFGGTSAPDPTSNLFAAENMAISSDVKTVAAAGCTAMRGQRVAVIGKAADEAQFPPVYPCFDRTTMADLLDQAGISWRYYLNTIAVGSIWNAPAAIRHICEAKEQAGVRVCTGADYVNNVISPQAQILTDIGNCNLPKVSWVIPDGRDSDHAGGTDNTGPAWVASIVNAIGTQAACPGGEQYWNNTAILITWDDWGGWYDHVPPFHLGGWPAHHWGAGYTYGFRVPLLVVSAYTRAGYVGNEPHDFGSILKFIEANYGLPRIDPGYYADAFATGLANFFTLSAPRPFKVIPAKVGAPYFLHRTPSTVGPDDE
jgi:phospholipase C